MIRRYKNGNIDLRVDSDDLKSIIKRLKDRDEYTPQNLFNAVFEYAINELDSVDTYIQGEPYCLGNYHMAYRLVCSYNGLESELTDIQINTLISGKSIKLNFYKKVVN